MGNSYPLKIGTKLGDAVAPDYRPDGRVSPGHLTGRQAIVDRHRRIAEILNRKRGLSSAVIGRLQERPGMFADMPIRPRRKSAGRRRRHVLPGRSMPASFQEILLAFEFVGSSNVGMHEAFLCRRTGKIYWRSEFSDLDELNDELPDDVEDDEKYAAIPDKRELGLGKPMVLDFAREFLPKDFDEVRYVFSKRGAYKKFRALLIRRNVLERWYDFESKATERALREWCELNSIEVAD
jgi:hypothetical protein